MCIYIYISRDRYVQNVYLSNIYIYIYIYICVYIYVYVCGGYIFANLLIVPRCTYGAPPAWSDPRGWPPAEGLVGEEGEGINWVGIYM